MNSILHVVPGLGERWSGIAVAARLLAQEQNAKVVDACEVDVGLIAGFDEVWVHSTWSWPVWKACFLTIRARKRLVRMTHGNLDPVRLRFHGWKKRLVGPIERYFLRRADRIVATCEAEKGWIGAYLGKRCPRVEVTDIKSFFDLSRKEHKERKGDGRLHLLYLGRRHPLKGLEFLKSALGKCENVKVWKYGRVEIPNEDKGGIIFRAESSVFGEEKEQVWEWCDVLVLPTLSENFGLVVAEALERGKRVITTDGAPAWGGDSLEFRVQSLEFGGEIWRGYGGRLLYLVGYREGSEDERVRLLKVAMTSLMDNLERQ